MWRCQTFSTRGDDIYEIGLGDTILGRITQLSLRYIFVASFSHDEIVIYTSHTGQRVSLALVEFTRR